MASWGDGTVAVAAGVIADDRAEVDLVGIPGCWSPAPSPDAGAVAFVSDRSGTAAVWVAQIEQAAGAAAGSAEPRLLETGPEPVLRVTWSPDGAWLGLLVAPGGGARTQVWVVRPDGSDLRRLAGDGTRTAFLGGWQRDGGLLGVSESGGAGVGSSADTTAYLVDPATGERTEVPCSNLPLVLEACRSAHSVLVRRGGRGRREAVLVDLRDGRVTPLISAAEDPSEGSTDLGFFGADATVVYLRTETGRDLAALVAVPIGADGEPGPAEVVAGRDDAELEYVAASPDGRTAALAWNVAGRSELELLDLASRRRRPGPALPAPVLGGVEFSADGTRLVVSAEGPAQPSGIWLTDPGARAWMPVSPEAAPPEALAGLVEPTLVRLTAHDGLPLSGWLYRPAGAAEGPLPTAVYLHSGPEAQERPRFSPLYQALLARGIAVFAPNVRGSSGFGRRFVAADNLAGRHDAVTDVETCVRHLIDTGVAEAGRIGCVGNSYGGYLTLASLVSFPDLFAAGVDICGMADFETFYARTEPWIAASAVPKYGHPDKDQELLRALSPLHRFDRLTAPLLVAHGARDTNVPVYESEQVVAAARALGLEVRFLLFPDEGHEIAGTGNRRQLVRGIVDWLARHTTQVAPARA